MGGQGLDGGGQSRDGGSPESPTRENPGLYSSQNIRAFYVIYFALGIAEAFYILSSGAC